MYVGYARVSAEGQRADLQKDALAEMGCDEIFWEHGSGSKPDRPGLSDALRYVRAGDVLVVWKLDRLGRFSTGSRPRSGAR